MYVVTRMEVLAGTRPVHTRLVIYYQLYESDRLEFGTSGMVIYIYDVDFIGANNRMSLQSPPTHGNHP